MMNDLISRQAAIDDLSGKDPSQIWDTADVEVWVNALPSAQPEIIRCRDCKHYYYADNRVPQEQRYVCDLDFCRWNPDDYCSYAERREE